MASSEWVLQRCGIMLASGEWIVQRFGKLLKVNYLVSMLGLKCTDISQCLLTIRIKQSGLVYGRKRFKIDLKNIDQT